MANFKNMAAFSPKNIPRSSATKASIGSGINGRVGQTSLRQGSLQSSSANNSNRSRSNFQQRLEVKKLLAAREAGAYNESTFLQKRLERKIANLAGDAYGTNTNRLQKSLHRQSGIDLNSNNNSTFNSIEGNNITGQSANNVSNQQFTGPVQLYSKNHQAINSRSVPENLFQQTEELAESSFFTGDEKLPAQPIAGSRHQYLRDSISKLLNKDVHNDQK